MDGSDTPLLLPPRHLPYTTLLFRDFHYVDDSFLPMSMFRQLLAVTRVQNPVEDRLASNPVGPSENREQSRAESAVNMTHNEVETSFQAPSSSSVHQEQNATSASGHANNIPTITTRSKKIIKKRKLVRAGPYTRKESQKLLDAVCDNNAYRYVNGNKLWKLMEKKKIVPHRSWESLRKQFHTEIIPHWLQGKDTDGGTVKPKLCNITKEKFQKIEKGLAQKKLLANFCPCSIFR